MSDYAYFYNSSNGDRKYDADSFSNWIKQLFTDGVISGGLQVIANGDMTLSVETGTGVIGGKVKIFTEKTTLKLDTASGTLSRIDNIVLRRDDEERDFKLAVVKGTPASSPKAPDLTRSGNVYELKLAEVRVERGVLAVTQVSVSDTRANRNVCGWVIGNTETIDAEQLLLQMNAAFSEWFETIKGQLTEDAAGNLQMQINNIKAMLSYGTSLPTSGEDGDVFILIES
jgi:hypothetical protein